MQVQVIATKDGSPDGNRRYKKGARYSISAKSAEFLSKIGWVRIATESGKRKDSAKE